MSAPRPFRVLLRAAQLASLLPASDQLAGAVTPVPALFDLKCGLGALQILERGVHGRCGGNNRGFHGGFFARGLRRGMRQQDANLTHVVQPC